MEQQSQVNQKPTTLSSKELVLVVDENNKEVGQEERWKVRSENLWHRASYIFVYNSKNQLFVQKRTMQKDYCPGYYDVVTGGVLGANETDEENAYRELQEELGITNVVLDRITTVKFEDETNRVWGNVYLLKYDGEVTLQSEEVAAIYYWTVKETTQKINEGEKITPDGINAFNVLLSMGILKAE